MSSKQVAKSIEKVPTFGQTAGGLRLSVLGVNYDITTGKATVSFSVNELQEEKYLNPNIPAEQQVRQQHLNSSEQLSEEETAKWRKGDDEVLLDIIAERRGFKVSKEATKEQTTGGRKGSSK